MRTPGAAFPAFCQSDLAASSLPCSSATGGPAGDKLSVALGQMPQGRQHMEVTGNVSVTPVRPHSLPTSPAAGHL